jgi:hypothetical protein
MRMICTSLLMVASFGLTACNSAVDDAGSGEDPEIDAAAASGRPSSNGLDSYKVAHDPIIISPGLSRNLLGHALRTGSLTSDVTSAICNDTTSDEVFRYIVQCALPSTSRVGINCTQGPRTFTGRLGLATTWGNAGGTCNTVDCREWVSACTLAHSNFSGQMGIPLRVTASTSALTGPPDPSFVNDEGAYWGNIFNDDGRGATRYGCAGSNAALPYTMSSGAKLKLMNRVCGSYTARGGCTVCDAINGHGLSGSCVSTGRDYLNNLSNGTVRSCATLCSVDAGATDGLFTKCTANGTGTFFGRIITVWRR